MSISFQPCATIGKIKGQTIIYALAKAIHLKKEISEFKRFMRNAVYKETHFSWMQKSGVKSMRKQFETGVPNNIANFLKKWPPTKGKSPETYTSLAGRYINIFR